MPEITSEIEKRVEDIEKRVSESKGQAALIARQILVKVQEGPFPSADEMYHIETGIVSGELERHQDSDIQHETIDLSRGILDSSNPIGDYYIYGKFGIPVERKLVIGNPWRFTVNFLPEDLEKTGKGELWFSRAEIGEMPDIIGYTRDSPCLEKLDVLVGDEEVRKFVDENVGFGGGADRFFKLLKEPGYMEKIVEEYYFRQREDISRNLVQEVARLKMLEQKVIELEGSVMKATAYFTTDDEGRGRYIEWSSKEVRLYTQLGEEIQEHIEKTSRLLEKADELGLTKHPSIDGNYVGFPRQVSPKEYLSHVKEKVVVGVNERLGKINAYLRAERERVERE